MSILGTLMKAVKPGAEEDSEPSIVKDLLSRPDVFKLEAEVINGEVHIKIKRRNTNERN